LQALLSAFMIVAVPTQTMALFLSQEVTTLHTAERLADLHHFIRRWVTRLLVGSAFACLVAFPLHRPLARLMNVEPAFASFLLVALLAVTLPQMVFLAVFEGRLELWRISVTW